MGELLAATVKGLIWLSGTCTGATEAFDLSALFSALPRVAAKDEPDHFGARPGPCAGGVKAEADARCPKSVVGSREMIVMPISTTARADDSRSGFTKLGLD